MDTARQNGPYQLNMIVLFYANEYYYDSIHTHYRYNNIYQKQGAWNK
jgi:hypothetical protein